MPNEGEYKVDMDALFVAVNFGVSLSNLKDVEMALQFHTQFMQQEKAQGKPNGPIAWYGMIRVLEHLLEKRSHLRAQAKNPEYLWVNNIK